jgi:hypothetical protein
MKNVTVKMGDKGILTITVDTNKSQGMSASGKTEIIGTTSGNVEVEDSGVFVGLNVYKYPTKK